MTRRARRRSAAKIELEPRTRRTVVTTLTGALRREREAGMGVASKAPSAKRTTSARDAPNFQANNPLFKERAPDVHVAYRPTGFSLGGRRVSRFMALHSLRITWVTRRGGVLLRLCARTGSSLTLHFRIAFRRIA